MNADVKHAKGEAAKAAVTRRIDGNQLPPQKVDTTDQNVEQSEELTREVFGESEEVNGGVGPQPDEHRGNAQGGFKYEGLPREEEPVEEDEEAKDGRDLS